MIRAASQLQLLSAFCLLGSSVPLAAQPYSAEDNMRMGAAGELRTVWRSRLNDFQDSAAHADRMFASASEAFAFARNDSAIARRTETLSALAKHSSDAVALGTFIGQEKALRYSNEMLTIGDALVSVKTYAEFLQVQARFRATRIERMEILSMMEQSLPDHTKGVLLKPSHS